MKTQPLNTTNSCHNVINQSRAKGRVYLSWLEAKLQLLCGMVTLVIIGYKVRVKGKRVVAGVVRYCLESTSTAVSQDEYGTETDFVEIIK